MEEEVHTMGAPILGSPGGPQRNRCDALDEESLRELLGFLGTYGQSKDTLEARRDLKETKQ